MLTLNELNLKVRYHVVWSVEFTDVCEFNDYLWLQLLQMQMLWLLMWLFLADVDAVLFTGDGGNSIVRICEGYKFFPKLIPSRISDWKGICNHWAYRAARG